MKTARRPSILLLFLLISFPSVDAVLFAPAMPTIAKHFGIGMTEVQFTISLYLFAYAISQLFYGMIVNAIGRKPALFLGLSLATLGSVVAGLSAYGHSFTLLLAARIVMALGAGVGLNMTFTLINDYFADQDARRVSALTSLAFPIMPGLASLVGGVITQYVSWDWCFYFLAIYGLVIFYLSTHLPNARAQTKHRGNFWQAVRAPYLWICGIAFGGCGAVAYLYAASAPIIVVHHMGFAPAMYGVFNLVVVGTYILGNLLAAYFANTHSTMHSIRIGWVITAIGAVALWWWLPHSTNTPWNLIIPASIAFIGIPSVFTNLSVIGTNHNHDRANNSAILSFITMVFAVLAISSLHWLNIPLSQSLPLLMLVVTCIMLIGIIGMHLFNRSHT